jgi:predicted RNA-binding protein YlqC (UPF0109 family)
LAVPTMKELVQFLARQLVNNPDAVEASRTNRKIVLEIVEEK